MTKIIDYTKQKPNNKDIVICPKCGHAGQWRHYPGESHDLIAHKKELRGIFWEITDSCTIKREVEQ